MSDGSIEVPWQWSWVPAPDADPAAADRWQAETAALFDEWVAAGAAPDPADSGAGSAGDALAGELRRRVGDLPSGARLLWGAGFGVHGPRWWPVLVVVERVGNAAGDPDYLLDLVGARTPVDGAPPTVHYSSTSLGDCVRVTSRERGSDGLVNALVRAATRIECPAAGDSAAVGADLLLTTRTWDMSLLAVIGPGVDDLMRHMAGAIAPVPAETETVETR
jgi:hypothetical protein